MSDPTPPPAAVAPIAGAQPKSALIAFQPESGIALHTMEDMFIFAKAVVNSGLAPKDFKTPEAVLIAVQMGAEIGLAPMAALQNIAVINGKPGLYGDVGKALLRTRGFEIEEMDSEEIKAKGFARCTITHARQKAVSRTFSVDDAKKAGLWTKAGPWSQYPYRQLAWRAFWFAARDAAADVLKGVAGVEEARDIPPEPKNVTPPAPAQRLTAIDAPAETVTEVPQSEPKPATEAAPDAQSEQAPDPWEGADKHTCIELIEGLMLDLGLGETKLAAEAVKAGMIVPGGSKKLSDLPDATLVFMRDYLRGMKK